MTLDELTFDVMQPLIGTSFRLAVEGRDDIELKITDVCKVMERVRSKRLTRQPFSIYFTGPRDIMVKQGMYPLRHEQLGEMPIFIVPVAQTVDGFEYEAVFT